MNKLLSNEQAWATTLTESLYYFTDYSYTLEKSKLEIFGKKVYTVFPNTPPWGNKWNRPQWLASHENQGPKQGYFQLRHDSDDNGRLDHIVANAYLSFNSLSAFYPTSDSSPTDVELNYLGRAFGVSSKQLSSGDEINRWIFEKLCNEAKCETKHKGILTDSILK